MNDDYSISEAHEMQRDEYIESLQKQITTLTAELEQKNKALIEIEQLLMKDKFYRLFTMQRFWHAHHVDLLWRMDGKDQRHEADWLKSIWYIFKRLKDPQNTEGKSND